MAKGGNRTQRTVVLLGLVLIVCPVFLFAQPVDGRLNANLVPLQPGMWCQDLSSMFEDLSCAELPGEPIPGYSYLLVVINHQERFPGGLGGFQFGIEYGTSVEIFSWGLCTGGLEIPQSGWPSSGTGNAVIWPGGCYQPDAETVVVGLFIISDGEADDFFRLTADPRIDCALFVDCDLLSHEVCAENLGGGVLAEGVRIECDDNCGTTFLREASWSRVKDLYRR